MEGVVKHGWPKKGGGTSSNGGRMQRHRAIEVELETGEMRRNGLGG